MLLTRESDYALRILRELSDGELKTVGCICENAVIPRQFAYKILKKLEGAGMLVIIRGAHGGCRKTEDMELYSLYDLIQAVGDCREVNACMDPAYECNWSAAHDTSCRMHSRLYLLQMRVDLELKSILLGELVGTAGGEPMSSEKKDGSFGSEQCCGDQKEANHA